MRAGRVDGVPHPVQEQGAVGQPGQRVVQRLVPQLLLEVGDLAEVLLQAAALEGGGHVPGEGVEQREVAAAERRDVTEAAADEQQPVHAVLGAQRGGHGVLEPAAGGVACPAAAPRPEPVRVVSAPEARGQAEQPVVVLGVVEAGP